MYGYDYGYDSYDYSSAADAVGIIAGMGIFMWIIGLAITIFSIVCMWKLFKKAGKPGYASIVPIYNIIVMLEIAQLPMWYIALFFVPIANIYAMFKIYIEIAHKFGKSTGFGVGMVFLNIIFIPMLAFGKSEYKGGVSTPVNFSDNANMPNNSMQFNQPMTNTNIPNMNNQSYIVNVNGNVGNSMMDVNMSNNGSSFQPVGNVNNNVNEVSTMVAPSSVEVNTTNNVVEPLNSVVSPVAVNETSIIPMPEVVSSTEEVNATNNVIEPVNSSVVNLTANPISNMKKTCPNCGNQVDFSAMFCTNCGNNL